MASQIASGTDANPVKLSVEANAVRETVATMPLILSLGWLHPDVAGSKPAVAMRSALERLDQKHPSEPLAVSVVARSELKTVGKMAFSRSPTAISRARCLQARGRGTRRLASRSMP